MAHTIKMHRTDDYLNIEDYAYMLGTSVERLTQESERPHIPVDMAYALAGVFGADPKEWL